MITFQRSGLTVSLLEPIRDRDRLGSRYCAGGYIWQVEDAAKGPLLTGPVYPQAPIGWDGQGLPEVFETALGSDHAAVGELVCVLGVGLVRRRSPVRPFHVRDNHPVEEFAPWRIDGAQDFVRMETRQDFEGYAAELIRHVKLDGRTLVSSTTARNRGKIPLPLRWFAHPFFPPTEILFRTSLEVGVPENPAYTLGSDGYLRRRPDFPWDKGHFLPLTLCFGFPLRVDQKHPLLGEVEVQCEFPVARFPVWGNDRTGSFEPYFHTVLEPGMSARWAMRYKF